MNVAILILNWNGKKDTLECLSSLPQREDVIIIDNGSHDDSVAAIRALHPEVTILETRTNLGFAGGNNVGIEYARAKGYSWILLLNNDTIVDRVFLREMLAFAEEKPSAGILGPKIFLYHNRSQVDHMGGLWDEASAEFISIREGPARSVDYVCGACMLVRRDVFDAIGLLEPKFFLLWEESDFCFRAKKAGFEIWTVPKAHIWHKVSASFIGGKPHSDYFWWRNRFLFIDRNFSSSEKRRLYQTIFPQAFKQLRHYLLFFLKRNRIKRLRCLAALSGMKDYLLGKFGNAPSKFFK